MWGLGWGTDGRGDGRATAPLTKRMDEIAGAYPNAKTAPRRGPSFRHGHRLEQAARRGPVAHLGVLATAPRRGAAVETRGIALWKFRASHSPTSSWSWRRRASIYSCNVFQKNPRSWPAIAVLPHTYTVTAQPAQPLSTPSIHVTSRHQQKACNTKQRALIQAKARFLNPFTGAATRLHTALSIIV